MDPDTNESSVEGESDENKGKNKKSTSSGKSSSAEDKVANKSVNKNTSSKAENAFVNQNYVQKLKLAMEQLSFNDDVSKSVHQSGKKTYEFWDTQPVTKFSEEPTKSEAIEPDKDVSELRQQPYSLPDGFEWDTLDLNVPSVLQEVYQLLFENYVEDDDNMFRFDYSADFLRWYWHRSLNPKKLIDVKFSHLGRNMTLQRTLKLNRLPDHPRQPGLRPLCLADVPQAHALLSKYLENFYLVPVFTEEEFKHWFLPQKNIIDCYVIENNGIVTDMFSYYNLPSTVMHHPQHKSIKAAYSFYNVATSIPWPDLMLDCLITAKNSGYDVFNALDLMNNKEFLDKLKFGIGDGHLQYYFFNWRCPSMPPEKVGLVLQ